MFGNVGTGSKERILGSIPLQIGQLKTGTCRSVRDFPWKSKIFRNRVRKAIINGVKLKE